MAERKGMITFKGEGLTLTGDERKVGDKAPDFTVLTNDLEEASLKDCSGKIKVICSVPSLDTPVCDTETRRFNEEAEKFSDDVCVLTISMDLPFAQARWCGAKGIENVKTLSDHRDGSFGKSYGVLIKELRLLARAIFIVDKDDVIQYIQLVNEVTDEPDYDEVIAAVKSMC